jgi:hypothetical protein
MSNNPFAHTSGKIMNHNIKNAFRKSAPKLLVGAALLFVLSSLANSMTVDWAGSYRFEYVEINSSTLSGVTDRGSKGYFLNHLSLSPKIIATDGFNVVANMEILPSASYPGSQVGTDFSSGPANSSTGTGTTSASTVGTMGQNQGASSVEVNQLYATWNHEYGQFAVGRMPIHFGLGVAHNAGTGLYDHWLETHDVVGYKFLIGNLSLMPMIGRTHHNYSFGYGSYATENMVQVDYTNPETESTFAIFHQVKSANLGSNDAAAYFKPYDTGTPSVVSGLSLTTTSLYIARGWESFKFKMEAVFQSGNTGVMYSTYQPTNTAGTGINMSTYGIATELDFPAPQSKWQWGIRTGIASGDDPRTQNFEGFFFSKNYDVAMLLFNHRMGGYDVLRTKLNHQRDSTGAEYHTDQTVDEESLSNTIYFAPKLSYLMSDRWTWNNSFVYATTQSNPSATSTSTGSDLGVEWDTGFTYKPHDKFKISMDLGMFLPGSAWQEGSVGRDATMTYGFTTKAAISF